MSCSSIPRVELSDGNKIPLIGVGTYGLGDKTKEVVKYAIELGYRHIDCAHIYGNEKQIGEAIREAIASGIVRREDLFITSKCWNNYHEREQVQECCRISLADLGVDYVDLYLIHFPAATNSYDGIDDPVINKDTYLDTDYLETWKGMEDCKEKGYARSIGLSNFNSKQIDRVLDVAKIRPVMNQVECHPYLNQQKLLDFCKARGITLTAFSPLGAPLDAAVNELNVPKVLDEPKFKEIGKKYGKTSAQVILRSLVQRGIVVVPRSDKQHEIQENFNIFDFELSDSDMDIINGCNRNLRYRRFRGAVEHPFYPFNEEY